MFAVDVIHNFKVGEIGEKDRGLNYVIEIQTGGIQHLAQILQRAARFDLDSAFHDRAGFRIDTDLPRAVNRAVNLDRLRVRSNRGRR